MTRDEYFPNQRTHALSVEEHHYLFMEKHPGWVDACVPSVDTQHQPRLKVRVGEFHNLPRSMSALTS